MNERDEPAAGSLSGKVRDLFDKDSKDETEREARPPEHEVGPRERREPPPKRPTDPPF